MSDNQLQKYNIKTPHFINSFAVNWTSLIFLSATLLILINLIFRCWFCFRIKLMPLTNLTEFPCSMNFQRVYRVLVAILFVYNIKYSQFKPFLDNETKNMIVKFALYPFFKIEWSEIFFKLFNRFKYDWVRDWLLFCKLKFWFTIFI